jgi:hypothetical protein
MPPAASPTSSSRYRAPRARSPALAVWDWDVTTDRIFTSPETEHLLGLSALRLDVLHPLDRDRFRASLDGVLEQRRGRLMQDFRLRRRYLWLTSARRRASVGIAVGDSIFCSRLLPGGCLSRRIWPGCGRSVCADTAFEKDPARIISLPDPAPLRAPNQ